MTEVLQLLREHVASLQVGDHQDIGRAGDVGPDALDLGGHRGDGVIERQWPVQLTAADLPTLVHLAQRRCIERGPHARVDRLDRGQQRNARPHDAQCVRQRDRVAHDIGLVLERGFNVDCRVGDQQRADMARHIQPEDVTEPTLRAQAATGPQDGTQQLIGMQAAFHQRYDFAAARKLDRLLGRGMAVRGILHPDALQADLVCVGDGPDAVGWAHQQRIDQAGGLGQQRALQ